MRSNRADRTTSKLIMFLWTIYKFNRDRVVFKFQRKFMS